MQPVFLFRNAFRYLSLRCLIVSSLLTFSACHLRYTPIDYSVVARNSRTLDIVHYIADNIKQNTVVFRDKKMILCDINITTQDLDIIRPNTQPKCDAFLNLQSGEICKCEKLRGDSPSGLAANAPFRSGFKVDLFIRV